MENNKQRQLYKTFIQCLLSIILRPLLCVGYFIMCKEYKKKTHVFSLMKLIFCQTNATLYFKFCITVLIKYLRCYVKRNLEVAGSIHFWRLCSWLLLFWKKKKQSPLVPQRWGEDCKVTTHQNHTGQLVEKVASHRKDEPISICNRPFLELELIRNQAECSKNKQLKN